MHSFFYALSRFMACLGGAMLVVLIALTCVSVVGRSLNTVLHGDFIQQSIPQLAEYLLNLGIGPVNGDFELIEAGVAFSIFAFLPLCQITAGHASVDIFVKALPKSFNRYLQLFIDVLFALVLFLIAVQLFSGLLSKMRSGQTTLLLEFPVWWAYALSMLGATIASVVAIYIAVARIWESLTKREILPNPDILS